ncbi:hypothetical protein PHMEG_00016291 [Phytophthora megakarya]|uniref:Uncharacterized protein n=1 Tax=Phytophthora megakarya TaxID=4795 RepID=A0A225W1A0_9STRA|nr:hypothetical protein PHMEG_00016291 [Phytophthora megakarya]
MQEIMRGLHERHAESHEQFEATDSKLTRSLRAHNRVRGLNALHCMLFQFSASAMSDNRMEDNEESENDTEDSDIDRDNKNPLVRSVVPATKSLDRHVQTLIDNRQLYTFFDQWKRKMNAKTTITRIRLAFNELLPRLMGARDYAGAAQVLGVMYHRFTLSPALCVEASLEILRRQPDYRNDLMSFYEAALEAKRIDMKEAEDDSKLLANFGILCYWLMFIESKELRDMLNREDTEYEEDEDDDIDPNDFGTGDSIESVIESNYLFKTPIGVHVLYQHASNALRRAVALNPSSAMFVEYYVQLLVLVGDIQPACDYLEAFFHINPDDPHAPRMLSGFLGCYYPDSVDAQVAVFSRWMKNDPSCSYALEKMLEFSSAGAVSSFVLTYKLVEALDTCGSDLYITQNPDVALTLWRNLAELLAAMDEDEFLLDQVERGETDPSKQVTIADVGLQHLWWKQVYFARPSTVEEVVAVSKQDSTFMEVSIYRAAVADRLFPGDLHMAEALCCAMALPDVTFSHEHVRLLKSFFPSVPNTTLVIADHAQFSTMPFINITVGTDSNRVLPIFKGSSNTLHVIDRKSVVAIEATGQKAEVVVTRETGDVDPQLVEELYEALEYEIGYSSMIDKRSQRKRKADAISTTATPILIPGFVGMVEEVVYTNPDASVGHICTEIHQKFRRSDMLIPTSKVVRGCVKFFRTRLKEYQQEYGHHGMLMRYEEFLTTFARCQRAKGIFKVTRSTAKAAIEEMKRVLPSPHPLFPDEKIVGDILRLKTAALVRQRRLLLMDLKKIMKAVLTKVEYVDDKTFVEAIFSVCKQNRLDGVVTRVDIARTLQIILPLHYYKILQGMDFISLHLLTTPEFRKNCTPEGLHRKLKERQSPVTLEQVKVIFWVEKYEALYGPIIDEENSDSSSDGSIISDSDSDDSSSDSDDSSSISDDSSSDSDSDDSSSNTDEEKKSGHSTATTAAATATTAVATVTIAAAIRMRKRKVATARSASSISFR